MSPPWAGAMSSDARSWTGATTPCRPVRRPVAVRSVRSSAKAGSGAARTCGRAARAPRTSWSAIPACHLRHTRLPPALSPSRAATANARRRSPRPARPGCSSPRRSGLHWCRPGRQSSWGRCPVLRAAPPAVHPLRLHRRRLRRPTPVRSGGLASWRPPPEGRGGAPVGATSSKETRSGRCPTIPWGAASASAPRPSATHPIRSRSQPVRRAPTSRGCEPRWSPCSSR